MSLIFVRLAAAALVVLFGALALPTASEAQTTALVGNLDEGDNAALATVTPTTPSGVVKTAAEHVGTRHRGFKFLVRTLSNQSGFSEHLN